MSLNVGARIMRVQPTLLHRSLHHRTSHVPALSIGLLQSQSPINSASRGGSRGLIYRNSTLQAQLRASWSSSAAQRKPADPPSNPSTPDSHISSTPPPPPAPLPEPLSDPLNPPASTRPPPLDLPVRDPSTKLFTHLFRLGKAYTTFYKTGLKAILTNRKLLRDLPDTPPPGLPSTGPDARGTASKATIAATAAAPPTSAAPSALSPPLDKSANPTRSSLLLRARVAHDTKRLPLFVLILIICGEFTPLIVLLFPRLTPYTCRIPTQATVIRRGIEARRAASRRALSHVLTNTTHNNSNNSNGNGTPELGPALEQVADGHICRSLGLGSALWDKMGFDVPFARSRAADAVARIVQDDALLRNAGGVSGLVDDEVVLACEERGIDTLDKDVAVLRDQLEAWIAKSAPSPTTTGDVEAMLKEATAKVRALLLGLDEPSRR
ncbi:hypothetical protein F5Y07DRAFT_191693 [Xylaria sp. FL0933]|nr:hypothetical protein F5Y07DRAFT_191693 [Xylaria sp. FL0933]